MKLKHYINKKSILLIYLLPYPSKNVKRNLGNDKKVQISTDITGMFYLLNPSEELLCVRKSSKRSFASLNHGNNPVRRVL